MSETSTKVATSVNLKGSLKVSSVVSLVCEELVSKIKSVLKDLTNYKFDLYLITYIGTYLKSYIKPKYLKNLDIVDLIIGVCVSLFDGLSDEDQAKIKSNADYLVEIGKIKRIQFFKRVYKNLKNTLYGDSTLKKF